MAATDDSNPELTTRPPITVPTKTGRRPWSTELLREWAALKYPGVHLYENLRLGPTTSSLVNVTVTPALEAALRVNNWYADGVLILPAEIKLIEAKVKAVPNAVGQVLFYLRLVRTTPALSTFPHLPVNPMVLFAEKDPDVIAFAQGLGCEVEVYTPAWIADYLQLVQFRTRT
jgi:hypothetical protein